MKLNLDNDHLDFKDEMVWVYKNGNIAVKVVDPHSTSNTIRILYTTGDILTYITEGDEYKLISIITNDGIVVEV